MPCVHSKMLMIAIAVVLLFNMINDRDDDLGDSMTRFGSDTEQSANSLVRALPPKDVYGDIRNTVWFKHYTGISEDIFNYVVDEIGFDITEARNIDFKYGALENYYRKRRPCKISVPNRIIHFLHTMRTGNICWDASHDNNWNIASVSEDFYHVLIHFVERFDHEWIRPMTEEEKDMGCLWWEYPDAYQAADGCHFVRRKSKTLPEGVRRRELYLYKHKYPEGQNVQAVVNHFGIATQVVTGMYNESAAIKSNMCHCPKAFLVL